MCLSLYAYSFILLGLCKLILTFSPFSFKVLYHLFYHFSELIFRLLSKFIFIYLDFWVYLFIYLFLSYCVWGPHFPRRLNSFFHLVFALLKLAQLFLMSIVYSETHAEFMCVCVFVFPSMGKAEWGSTPFCWWLACCFFACLPFKWGVLHRVLLMAEWYQVLYLSGFLYVSSHYLIPPRVSSLLF